MIRPTLENSPFFSNYDYTKYLITKITKLKTSSSTDLAQINGQMKHPNYKGPSNFLIFGILGGVMIIYIFMKKDLGPKIFVFGRYLHLFRFLDPGKSRNLVIR